MFFRSPRREERNDIVHYVFWQFQNWPRLVFYRQVKDCHFDNFGCQNLHKALLSSTLIVFFFCVFRDFSTLPLTVLHPPVLKQRNKEEKNKYIYFLPTSFLIMHRYHRYKQRWNHQRDSYELDLFLSHVDVTRYGASKLGQPSKRLIWP